MLRKLQQKEKSTRILMGVILTLISISMLWYLIPGVNTGFTSNPDAVARVGNEQITRLDVQNLLNRQMRGQTIPAVLRGLYAHQILDQMIFQKCLELEAQRLGLRVTPEEMTDRIKLILPMVFTGDTWVGKDRYAAEVQARTGMSVQEFEDYLRDEMLQVKFRELVTDAIRVTPAEVEQEFRRRNEKVKLEYALIKPADLASLINPTDAELADYFKKNASKYQVPEKRSGEYALLDQSELRQRAMPSDEELKAYYNQHLSDYQVPNRVHVEHILFKTIGKTDAEVAEIRKNAEDVLKKAKLGANFEDLAKKYSEDDTTKPKGGDLGWIVQGQTVPEFQGAAFSLPKGTVSDLVKTQYGFHIIKVLDHENAHTKSFEEVRASILPVLQEQKTSDATNRLYEQIAAALRQSNRQPIADIAKKFGMKRGEIPPTSVTEPVADLGNSPDLHQALFELRPGELSGPLHLDRGLVILTVKQVLVAHPATLPEVRAQVLDDYRREKSSSLARGRADELAKRVQFGEPLDRAAKALGIATKNTDFFSRTGSVPDLGSGHQFEPAFSMKAGQTGPVTPLAGGWVLYTVAQRQDVIPADLEKQRAAIERELLEQKQSAAFDAFRLSLEDRLRREGKLVIDQAVLKQIVGSSS